MLFVTIKGLIAHKFRLFATALAVTLGVAFMSGTLVLTDTVSRTFDDLFGDVYQQTDAVVRGEEIFDGGVNVGAQRGRIDESVLATVRSVPGVAEAQGGVFGYARLIGCDADEIALADSTHTLLVRLLSACATRRRRKLLLPQRSRRHLWRPRRRQPRR